MKLSKIKTAHCGNYIYINSKNRCWTKKKKVFRDDFCLEFVENIKRVAN